MDKKEIVVSISEHTWLDLSASWFVYINGVKSGGECSSLSEATDIATSLAKQLGGILKKETRNTNELFSQ